MQLKISENLKNFRKKNGFTQEYLAEQLNVSTAAVCKWESGASNPDITLLIPISRIFDISVDELLGYDIVKEKCEIDKILKEYSLLTANGQNIKAKELITQAKTAYPCDFGIMNEYMWNIVGGRNIKKRDVLVSNYTELDIICQKILSLCKDEKIRYEARIMKAKLLYAAGQREKAEEVINSLPRWDGTAEQQFERLYDPGTPEAIYWTQRNVYGLADGLTFKLVKLIWSDSETPLEAKTEQTAEIGKQLRECWTKTKQPIFLIMEHMVFAALAKKLLSFDTNYERFFEMTDYQLNSAKEITLIAKTDKALRDLLLRTYKTDDLFEYTLNFFKTADHESYKKIRLKLQSDNRYDIDFSDKKIYN